MNVIDLLFQEQAKQLDRLEYECSSCGTFTPGNQLEERFERNECDGELDVKLICKRCIRLGWPWE